MFHPYTRHGPRTMQMIGQNDPGINLERTRLRYLANDIFHRVQALRQAEDMILGTGDKILADGYGVCHNRAV
jgi:hypothetical protein